MGYKWDVFKSNLKTNIEVRSEIAKAKLSDVGAKTVLGIKKSSKYVWDNNDEIFSSIKKEHENNVNQIQTQYNKQLSRAESMSTEELR